MFLSVVDSPGFINFVRSTDPPGFIVFVLSVLLNPLDCTELSASDEGVLAVEVLINC